MVIETGYLKADVSDSKTGCRSWEPPGRSSSHSSILWSRERVKHLLRVRAARVSLPTWTRPDDAGAGPAPAPPHRRGKANGHPARVPTTPLPRFDAALHRQNFCTLSPSPGHKITASDRQAETPRGFAPDSSCYCRGIARPRLIWNMA